MRKMNDAMSHVMSSMSANYANPLSMEDREDPVHSMQEAQDRARALHAELRSDG